MNVSDFVQHKGTAKNMAVALTLEHVSPVTRLLEKRKQMLEVQKSLDAQKDEYQRKEELFKRREENLRKKDLELQEALVLFNKFLKENEHKRRRADHRANEEIKKRIYWENQIEEKKKTLQDLNIKVAKLIKKVNKNSKFETYLTEVQKMEEHGNHFDEINSITQRYETLKKVYNEMIEKQIEKAELSEQLRKEFQDSKKRQYNHILQLNNEIATKSKELEDQAKSSADVEERIVEEENKESERKTETTKIIMAVDNLHNRCRRGIDSSEEVDPKKQGEKHKCIIKHAVQRLTVKEKEVMDTMSIKKWETGQKLDVIGNYIENFIDMVREIKNANKKQQDMNTRQNHQTLGRTGRVDDFGTTRDFH